MVRKPVPWTDLLANVTSKDPVAQVRSQIGRDFFFIFDRKIGETAPGVDRPVWQDATGGTGSDAACTLPAAVGSERRIRFQFDSQQDFSQQEV